MKQRVQRFALLVGLLGGQVAVGLDHAATVSAADDIPDVGLPAELVEAEALVSERTERLEAGVIGVNKLNDAFPQMDTEVLAFAEHDGVMYVGGKFTQVEIASTRQRFSQPFLAAFDRDTGRWISSFRPTIDGNVWDLKVTDDGQLIVAGQFRKVNGAPNTAGVAMIDLATGDVNPNWHVNLVVTGTTRWALGRALDIEGDHLYIAGNFTRITGPNGNTARAGQMARVNLATGNVDGTFLPNFDGIVFDVDAIDDKVYAVGNYFNTNGSWTLGQTTLRASDGQLYPGQNPPVRTDARVEHNFQQAILSLGDEVWMTGSQHNTQVYDASDFSLLRGFISQPYGDGQTLAELNGIVYKGSHANSETVEHADTSDYPDLAGATSSKPIKWIGAWDATIGGTHDHTDWYPQISTKSGEGGWELFADSVDCLWAGGDFNRGSYDGDVARYVGGFARFCTTDDVAPSVPTDLIAELTNSGVELAWTGTGDDRGGAVQYELLKNDAVVATTATTTFVDAVGTVTDRYFVRAVDGTGNRSATTAATTATPDTEAPSVPQNVAAFDRGAGTVELRWDASTDDRRLADYIVFEDGTEVMRVAGRRALLELRDPGPHSYSVVASDRAGNLSAPSILATVTVSEDEGLRPPSTPTNVAASVDESGDVTVSWSPSLDDGIVVEYIVFANGVEVGRTAANSLSVASPPAGAHLYRVAAVDDDANQSALSAAFDVEPPGTNIARGRTATASSVFFNLFPASWAIDGDRTSGLTTLFHSRAQVHPWWQVDLGAERAISDVLLVNRTDCCADRLTDVYVFVSDTDMTSRSFADLRDDPGVRHTRFSGTVGIEALLDVSATGRYVRVQLGGTSTSILQLAEVEIYAAGSDNAARAQPATASSVFRDDPTAQATSAVDGDRTSGLATTFRSEDEANPWWQVDLGAQRALSQVQLVNTTDGDPSQLNDVYVFVSDTDMSSRSFSSVRNDPSIWETRYPGTVASDVLLDLTTSGRFVRVQLGGTNSLQLAEVEVYEIEAADIEAPTMPADLTAVVEPDDDVVLSWTASTDNIGVVEYVVFQSGNEVANVSATTATLAPGEGSYAYQVWALDAAGNASALSASVNVKVVGEDVTPPAAPQALFGEVDDNGDVTLTWSAAIDDVGVAEYVVLRNGVEIDRVTVTTADVAAPGPGSHWYQVRAVDAAGNESVKTPPVQIII